MTYYELIQEAEHKLNHNKITLGEYEEMIKPLKQEIEQEPCVDCISRQAVEKITWEEPSYDDALNVLTEVRDKVRALPSVEPQRHNGEWIIDDDFEHHNARCNKCGNIIDSRLLKWYPQRYAYCSSCGAKMEVEK